MVYIYFVFSLLFVLRTPANGPALSCGADKFRNATNEMSSC